MSGNHNSGRIRDNNIWDGSVTVHQSIKEDMNAVLLRIANMKKKKKARMIEALIETHPDYIKVKKEMEEEGFFI